MEVLKQKTYRNYPKLSRYASFPIYYHSLDNKYLCGTNSWLSDSTPYQEYQTRKGDTLDLISLMFYSSSAYYWVIADFNRIVDPYADLKEGTIIKIPVLTKLKYEDF